MKHRSHRSPVISIVIHTSWNFAWGRKIYCFKGSFVLSLCQHNSKCYRLCLVFSVNVDECTSNNTMHLLEWLVNVNNTLKTTLPNIYIGVPTVLKRPIFFLVARTFFLFCFFGVKQTFPAMSWRLSPKLFSYSKTGWVGMLGVWTAFLFHERSPTTQI